MWEGWDEVGCGSGRFKGGSREANESGGEGKIYMMVRQMLQNKCLPSAAGSATPPLPYPIQGAVMPLHKQLGVGAHSGTVRQRRGDGDDQP